MTTALWAVLGFATWTVALAHLVAGYRAWAVLTLRRGANSFQVPPDSKHQDFSWRLTRAQINALENLPVFFVLVWIADRAGASAETAGNIAIAILLARVGQTIAHLASARSVVVNVRFAFFVLQVAGYSALVALILMT